MPTRFNRWFLLQILLLAQHVSGTIMPIIRSSRVLYRWLLPVVFGVLVFKLSVWCGATAAARKPDTQPSAPHHTDNLKTKAPNTTGSNHLYNTLELLMMGIVVPETCWASSKFCNKNHLLHLVGILSPHIATVSLKTITSCFRDGQAVRVFSEVGTGLLCYLDEYHIQRLLLKRIKKGRMNETWQQNVSKNENNVAQTYEKRNTSHGTNCPYRCVMWKMQHKLLYTVLIKYVVT